jgi:hypothetical protein
MKKSVVRAVLGLCAVCAAGVSCKAAQDAASGAGLWHDPSAAAQEAFSNGGFANAEAVAAAFTLDYRPQAG